MEIQFNCESCSHAIRIDEACVGLFMKCAHCSESVIIPSPSSGLATLVPHEAPVQQTELPEPASVEESPAAPADGPRSRGSTFLRKPWHFVVLAELVLGAMAIALSHHLVKTAKHATPQPPAIERGATEIPDTADLGKVTKSAEEFLAYIQSANTQVRSELPRADYGLCLAKLATKLDALLSVGEQTGLYAANKDVRDLCIAAAAAYFDHNQALNEWDVAILVNEELEALAAAQKTGNAPADAGERIDQLAAKAKNALHSREQLWDHARKQTETGNAIFSRLKK